jgi:hypothetical protein
MDADERLRLDYDQTTALVRTLLDVRFKLLALVPTIAGAAVALVGSGRPPAAELLAVGLLGLLATLGILLYELHNIQIYDAALTHAQAVEGTLGLRATGDAVTPGQLLSLRDGRSQRLFGLVSPGDVRALGLVYGAAMAGWSYLVGWGALRAVDFSGAREVGGVIAAIAAITVIFEIERLGRAARA